MLSVIMGSGTGSPLGGAVEECNGSTGFVPQSMIAYEWNIGWRVESNFLIHRYHRNRPIVDVIWALIPDDRW